MKGGVFLSAHLTCAKRHTEKRGEKRKVEQLTGRSEREERRVTDKAGKR